MIVLGLILLAIGLVTGIVALWAIGAALAALGAVLHAGEIRRRAVGRRCHYW